MKQTAPFRLVAAGLILLGSMLAVFTGCDEEPPSSLYDPSAPGRPQPVISGISPPPTSDPATAPLGGVTTITLAGSNFSTVLSENLVYFDASVASVLNATATQLQVRAPNVPKDSLRIKVAVLGAELFSDASIYSLQPAMVEYARMDSNRKPHAMAVDAAGNLFVSLFNSSGLTVNRVLNDTLALSSFYSPVFASSARFYTTMKAGPGNELYAAARQNAIYKIAAGGGAAALWLRGGGLGVVFDFDFDATQTLWAVGPGTSIYRVRISDRNVKLIPFNATARTARVYNNNLYVGGKVDTVEAVWRFPIISPDSLGAPTLVFDFTRNYPGFQINSVTFAADGDMLIGTDAPAGIVLVRQSGAHEPLYFGMFAPKIDNFAYGTGVFMFASREFASGSTQGIRINLQKGSAPYYGRQ